MKDKKTLLIILPIVAVVVIAIIAIIILIINPFKSDKELFLSYFKQNLEIFDIMENPYIDEQKQTMEGSTYQSNGELSITLQNEEETQNMNVLIDSRHDFDTDSTYADITLKQADQDILTMSYINSNNIYAAKSDQIITNYIGIENNNLQDFINQLGIQDDLYNMPNEIDLGILENIYDFTDIEKQHISNTYLNMILNSIPDKSYKKLGEKQVSSDSTNYITNEYQLSLDKETVEKILINFLMTLRNDNTTMSMISDRLSKLGLNTEITDISNITQYLDELIGNIQNGFINIEGININIYEKDGKLVKTIITSPDSMKKITIEKNYNDDMQKVIISVDKEKNIIDDATQEVIDTYVITSQLILQKTQDDYHIVNQITIIPDISKNLERTTINIDIGSLQDNEINNMSEIITVKNSSGNKTETISSSYTQNINLVEQVEEITQLDATNTVILNGYKSEILSPFIEQLKNKIIQSTQAIHIKDENQLVSILETAYTALSTTNGINIKTAIGIPVTEKEIYDLLKGTETEQPKEDDNTEDYNEKFSQYEGEITGSSAKTLCDVVKNHNLSKVNNPAEQVSIQLSSAKEIKTEPTNEITMEAVNDIQLQIKNDKKYNVDFGYSETTGKIVAIGITEIQN